VYDVHPDLEQAVAEELTKIMLEDEQDWYIHAAEAEEMLLHLMRYLEQYDEGENVGFLSLETLADVCAQSRVNTPASFSIVVLNNQVPSSDTGPKRYGYRWGYSAAHMEALARDEATLIMAERILASEHPSRIFARREYRSDDRDMVDNVAITLTERTSNLETLGEDEEAEEGNVWDTVAESQDATLNGFATLSPCVRQVRSTVHSRSWISLWRNRVELANHEHLQVQKAMAMLSLTTSYIGVQHEDIRVRASRVLLSDPSSTLHRYVKPLAREILRFHRIFDANISIVDVCCLHTAFHAFDSARK
jgi:hypothetical protein